MIGEQLRRRGRGLADPLSIPAFRRLWAADLVSLLGDWAGRLALSVLVFDRTGSAGWTAAVTAVSLAGFVGIGQVLASLADRHGRISVMLLADAVRGGCFLLMLLPVPVGGLLVFAFLAGLATPPFEAARAAALPDIVPEHRYEGALVVSQLTVQTGLLLGNALGGLLLTIVQPKVALALNALTFGVSALLLLGLRATPAARPGHNESLGVSLRTGAEAILGDRMIRRALAVVAITGLLGTAMEALVVPYADVIGLRESLLGLLAAVVPVGTLLGTVLVTGGRTDNHSLLRKAALMGLGPAAIAAVLFSMEAAGALAFVAFLVGGAMFALSIPTNIVIALRLQRQSRATVMGIAVGMLMGSQALGAFLGGLVATWAGEAATISAALAMSAAFCAWSFLTTPHEAKHLVRGGRPSGAERSDGAPVREPASTPA